MTNNNNIIPGRHSRHGPPSGPLKPGLHKQSMRVVLPASEMPWGGQDVHKTAPDWEYLPGSQVLQSVGLPRPLADEFVPAAQS